MSRLWKCCGQVIALMLVSPCLLAASFDCKRAANTVERNICGDTFLSQLDSDMAAAYERARVRSRTKADTLLRDQRNWVSTRNAAAIRDTGLARWVYIERIDFLDSTFQGNPHGSPLLSAIAAHVAANPKASAGRGHVIGGWDVIGGDGNVFSMAKKISVDNAHSLPFRLEDVTNLITDGPSDEYQTLALLEGHQLGGIYAEGGTLHAVAWRLFRWAGKAVKSVDLPPAFSETENTHLAALVDYRGAAYALSYFDGMLAYGELTAQPFTGTGWGDDVHLELRYDVHLRPPRSHCAEANCTTLQTFAEQLVRQFDQSPDISPLIDALSSEDKQRFDAFVQRATGTKKVPRTQALDSLPEFDGTKQYADDIDYTNFGSMSSYFPVQWHGQLLIGRIGHGAMGWRETEDLVLGIWRCDGQNFVPVLGMGAHKVRGDFLFSVWRKVVRPTAV